MSKSLTLNNNIKELNLNKNSEIIDTNAIQLGDGVDYYNKYKLPYCWGKELNVQYQADSNFAIEVTTPEHICANSLKQNFQINEVIPPFNFKATYGDTIHVNANVLSYGGEVTTNTKNSSNIAYNVRLKGKGTDWEGQILEDTLLTPTEWKCNYKVFEFTGKSSGTYPNYTYDVSYLKNDAAYTTNRPAGYYLHMFPLGDINSIGITSQDDIIAFRIDDGNLSSSTASTFLYLRDKSNSNILKNNGWIRSSFDNSSQPEDSSCLIYQDSKAPKDVYFNTIVNSKDILLQFGYNGWMYDPEASGSRLINYSGISIEDNKLYLNIVSDKNFRSIYGEKIAFAGRVVIYYGREDYVPTYEFTTSQSVLCRTKLNIAIGSYQYRGTSAELNAMTILSNNGIIGVSKIVEVHFVDSESLLSPNAQTTAGISMTGENTFKISASASERTSVTVTYKIVYQK